MRERTERGYVGRNGVTGFTWFPMVNVLDAVINVSKIDAQSTNGSVQAIGWLFKDFQYTTLVTGSDLHVPFYYFPFVPPDAAASAREFMRALALTVTLNGGSGVVAGTTDEGHYHGRYGMLDPRSIVTGLTGSLPFLSQEANGLPWSLSWWMFKQNNNVAGIYYEGNAALTNFLLMQTSATGQVLLATNGGTRWTSTAAITSILQWHHHVVTYDGANLRHYVDGALASGPTVYAHAAGLTGDRVILNSSGNNVNLVSNIAVYQAALSADEVFAQYSDLTFYFQYGLNISSGSLAQNQVACVVVTNNSAPGLYTPNAIVLPICDILNIQTNNGVFFYDARFRLREAI